jgi:hypothetical protein
VISDEKHEALGQMFKSFGRFLKKSKREDEKKVSSNSEWILIH